MGTEKGGRPPRDLEPSLWHLSARNDEAIRIAKAVHSGPQWARCGRPGRPVEIAEVVCFLASEVDCVVDGGTIPTI
jgi:NAD(P)-dependent dehydrogenase (short-subunit alcohol dehydrogenase family)